MDWSAVNGWAVDRLVVNGSASDRSTID